MLIVPIPRNLRLRITDPWPANPEHGRAILAGEIEFNGELIRKPAPVWSPRGASDEWIAKWNGFDWLADLMSGDTEAREAGRAFIEHWLAENKTWDPVIWRSEVLATRIFSWIVYFQQLAGSEADQRLRSELLKSIMRQTRHLLRVADWERQGVSRLRAIKGLIGGIAALTGSPRRMDRALRILQRELRAQLTPEGAHRSRSPSVQVQVLRDLIDTREVLRASRTETPKILEETMERMASILRFYRHGDGRLALFNGSVEDKDEFIELLLERPDTRSNGAIDSECTGFQRLRAGDSLVLFDGGRPPPPGFDAHTHAGALSFEFSHGGDRIIVNSGGYSGRNLRYRRLAQASAAHSVLTVNDANSVEIEANGLQGEHSLAVHSARTADAGHQWVVASHDGYVQRFGLTYSRELYLAPSGNDMRGEETLTGRGGHRFAVHFHLHPNVEASLVQNGSCAWLRLPSGAVWSLRAVGAEISLVDSFYFGSGKPKKSKQIVLSGITGGEGVSVPWAIRREVTTRE